MEAENLVAGHPQSSEWEVYKDVFAPPHPTRRVKPWDREPVPAHAPRLHGQKIWKKTGSKPRGHGIQEKDNAQTELDLEGIGARKRMRGIGEKENISDATWLLQSRENGENLIDAMGSLSPVKKDGHGVESDALLVPRKRTNANRLITPKKSKKKVPLQDVTQSFVDNLALSAEPMAVMKESLSPAFKPARRTKSLRKSFRRLSRDDSAEEGQNDQLEAVETNPDSSLATNLLSESTQDVLSSQPVDIFGIPSSVAEEAQLKVEIVEVEKQPAVCVDGLPVAGEIFQALEEGTEEVEVVPGSPQINILPTLVEEDSGPIRPDIEGVQDNALLGSSRDSSTRAKSITSTTNGETPTKKVRSTNSRTPKKSPVKRSTRVTRSSSLLPELETPKSTQRSINTNELLTARSPCKAQRTPQPRTTNIDELQSESHTLTSEANLTTACTPHDLSVAPTSSQIQGDVVDGAAVESDDITNIQQTINPIATEPLDFVLSPPRDSVDHEAVGPLPEIDSTIRFESQAFELPSNNLVESDIGSPKREDSQSPNSDDSSEVSENLDYAEEKTVSIGQAVEPSGDDNAQAILEPPTAATKIEDNAAEVYNRDDTDLLRNFLTRVKADKAAKASNPVSKRKRSLPHSPIQLPLGTIPAVSSPTSPKAKDDVDEFDVGLPSFSPSKRTKIGERTADEDELTQPKPTRRSGRTRLPVKSAPLVAPSFIPLRRLGGQDGDNTVTLRRNEEKELATLTKFNTRKNKGGASLPPLVLAKKAEEKDNPAAKHKALKEAFDDNAAAKKAKNKKGRNVVWAEEIAQFQSATIQPEPEPILPPAKEENIVKAKPEDKKPVKVGMRSKIALGMATNGTPAPKRQLKPRRK